MLKRLYTEGVMLSDILINDADCVEILAYVAYCEGRDEQIIHNERFYKRVIFAQQIAMSNFNIFIEANQLKKEWQLKPELMSNFKINYNL